MSQPEKSGAAAITRPSAPPTRAPEPGKEPVEFEPTTLRRPAFIRYTYHVPMKIGNHIVVAGDVVEVTSMGKRKFDRPGGGARTSPVFDNRLFEDRAAELVNGIINIPGMPNGKNVGKRAEWHEGPATVRILEPTEDEVMASMGIRTASANRMQQAASHAVAQRQQKPGAM